MIVKVQPLSCVYLLVLKLKYKVATNYKNVSLDTSAASLAKTHLQLIEINVIREPSLMNFI